MQAIIDTIYILDIVIQFRTTYFDKMTGNEIWDLRKISRKYMKGSFFIDLLATVSIVPNIFGIQGWWSGLEFFGLLKLLRINRFRHVITNSNQNAETKALLVILYVVFILIVYIHFIACFIWWTFNRQDDWVAPKEFGYL